MNRSARQILFIVAFGVFIAADDLTVVSTMLRQIIVDLEIPLPDGLDQAAWIVNAYLIAYVIVMPFVGRLSDIVGRRAVYVGSLLLFLVGSIWIPFADSFGSFLAGRVLTALGGGAMVPVAMAVLADVYPAEKRATALGTLGAIDTAGWVWGPLYGALLIRFLNWRWQFYLNIPLTLIAIVLAWRGLANLPTPSEKKGVDWAGTAVFTIALLCLNLALLGGGDIQTAGGFDDFAASTQPTFARWGLYLGALIAFGLFIWIEARQRQTATPPLIDLSLFRRPNFSAAIGINFFIGVALIIGMVNVPLLINVLIFDVGRAALTSGYLLSGLTGAMAIAAYLSGKLTEQRGYRLPAIAGSLACFVGYLLLGRFWQIDTPLIWIGGFLGLVGAGFGLVMTPIGTAVINAAPDDQRGISASLVIVMRLIGMSVGLSALTAYGLSRFETLRTQIVLPEGNLTDPAYQKAIADGLTQLSVQVLTETFLLTAVCLTGTLLLSLNLKKGVE